MLSIGKCTNPADCITKTDDRKLCKSCKRWFKELKDSHENGKNPWWHKNCKSAQWSEDHWGVAKYFMPALGSNLSAVKDAQSTDLSSLLNVLEWMKDAAFLGKTRVNVDLVRKLRSQVRNTWAHAPQHELTEDEKAEGFSIATDFLKDLENVSPNIENSNCLEHLEYLKTNGITNVVESELQSLLLQCQLLDDIKEEIANIKFQRLSDKSVIEEQRQKLEKLKRAWNECSQKMGDFERFKNSIGRQFNQFAEELKSFHCIRDSIEQILAKINEKQKEQEPTSYLPDKLINFTGRKAEIQKVITLLTDEKKAIVSLHGGPGFGKTAIAIEISHKLDDDHTILVVFSQLIKTKNEDQMIRQLCLDAGVNHEDDPKQSLMPWLKNITRKVIFVMDHVDKLLEKCRSAFDDFIRLLRKNSNCQIITTSRSSYLISELSNGSVEVGEMDDEAGIKFLRKQLRKEGDEEEYCYQDEKFLRRLAKLCGNIPLAMCIAGSLVDDYEDSNELLKDLKTQPMKTLQSPESNQYVNRAINVSYDKLSKKDQETFVRLSVFEGSFSVDAARTVIEMNKLDARRVLKELLRRSLIKKPTKHRYSIHLLIKHYLKDKRDDDKRAGAEALMVEYYLELGNYHTLKSWSKDCYKQHREALKREASNIQSVLKICCKQKDPEKSKVPECLASSEVFKTSARLFSYFIRSIIPTPIVYEFLQRCANLAKERKQHAIKMNFDCLLAAEKRGKLIGKSDEDFMSKMEIIKEEFETHCEELKKDKVLCAHYYYQYGRYLSQKSKSQWGKERLKLHHEAREQLKKSLQLRESLASTPEGMANKIFTLMHLGNVGKSIYTSERYQQNTRKADEALQQAQENYNDAIELSKVNLGENPLTLWIHKNLGDLFLTANKNLDRAKQMYIFAKNMSENLGLDASFGYVLLLNNLGICLSKANRVNEAIEVLKKARDIADELDESKKPDEGTLKVYASLADCLKQDNRADEGIQVLQKAREKAEKLAENDELTVFKMEIHILLTEYLKQSDRANEAVGVLRRGREIAEKLAESNEPNERMLKVFTLLADCLKQNDRADQAVEVLEKARVNAEKLAENDELTVFKTEIYILLAECLKQSQRTNEAIEVLEKARNNAEKLAVNDEPTVRKVKVYKLLAECLKQSQRLNEAIEVLEKARDNTEKLAVNDEPTVHKIKVYLLLAECLKQSRRTNEAIEVLEKARDNAEKLAVNDEPTVHKAKIYLLLAECLKQNQRVNEAIEILEKARDNTEKLAVNDEPTVHKTKVYLLLAECLKQNQRVNEAIEILEKARDNTEKLAVNDEPTVHKAKVYLLLAECLKQNQRVNEAIEILEKARDNTEKLAVNDEPTVHKAKVYLLLAECLKQNQRVNEAIEILEKACDNTEKLAVNDEPTVHKTKVYLLLAECLKQNQRVNEAIEILEKARDNTEKLAVNDEPTVHKTKVYLLLAECLKQNQRVNEAIEILEKARDNTEKLAVNDEPTVHKTKVYLLLAECLKQNQRVNEAIEILEKARDNTEKLAVNDEPTVHKAKVYLLLAECLKQNQRVNEAIEILEKARDNTEKLAVNDEPTVHKAKVYLLLAECLIQNQRVNEAIEILEKARDNTEKLAVNDEPTVHKAKVYLLLAECLIQNQRVNEAIEILEKARDNTEKLAVNDEPTVHKAKVYLLLAECLIQNQRVNEAIEILEKARDNTEKLAVNDEPTVHKAKVYLLLAECLIQNQRVNEAIEILEKVRDNTEKLAVNDEPTVHKIKVYLLLAECLKQSRRTNEAIEVLKKVRDNAEKLAKNDEPTVHKMKVYLLLAECLKQSQRTNEAIEVLEKARDNAEKLAENDESTVYKTKVYTSLAIVYHTLQNDSEAVRYANKACEFDQLERTIKRYEYKKLQEILQITVNLESN